MNSARERVLEKMARMLKGIRTAAIICTQWGDSGKGKLVDIFADLSEFLAAADFLAALDFLADIIARGTGGANAGHTIVIDGKKYVLHLIPCGIIRRGKKCVIGSGVVIDPRALCVEFGVLRKAGVKYAGRLFIAQNAKLVLPQHIAIEALRESTAKKGRIGTTGRGIGLAYEDHYRRIGLTMNDLLNPRVFSKKLKRNLAEYDRVLKTYGRRLVKKVMNSDSLENGKFYDAKTGTFNRNAIVKRYMQCAKELACMVRDTDAMLRKAVGKKCILLEGAQGNMLSVDHGTYPYVTSSDSTVDGLAKGVGLSAKDVDLVVAIAKAFYITRVGEGPFPTEMGGKRSARWCGSKKTNRERERKYLARPDDGSEFRLGMAIRDEGDEFGATTGRPRRTGWFDVPLLRFSLQFCGNCIIALTKLDVLNNQKTIKICTAYRYTGPDYRFGERLLKCGAILRVAIPVSEVMAYCEPIYKEMPGWMCDISKAKQWDDLPRQLLSCIRLLEKLSGKKVCIASVGKDRKQTIFKPINR